MLNKESWTWFHSLRDQNFKHELRFINGEHPVEDWGQQWLHRRAAGSEFEFDEGHM